MSFAGFNGKELQVLRLRLSGLNSPSGSDRTESVGKDRPLIPQECSQEEADSTTSRIYGPGPMRMPSMN